MKELISFLAIWFKNLKEHTWRVKIDNQPTGTLADPKVSKSLEKIDSGIKSLLNSLENIEEKSGYDEIINVLHKLLTKGILVNASVKQAPFPKSMEISNFPALPIQKDIVFPRLQKVEGQVQVTNQVDLEEVIRGLQTVVDVINELRLEMPKSFPTGVATSVQGAAKEQVFNTNNIDNAVATANTVYIGNETKLGEWMVKRIKTTTLATAYATSANNPSIIGYSHA